MGNTMYMTKHNQEAGVASILTVIFFILIISVITLSFLRITLQEGEQTLDDALSKSAYAAAQSGVSDAKRVLLFCKANPAHAACADLTKQECPGFADGGMAALGIPAPTNGSGVPVGSPELNERYTCTIITTDTLDVQSELSDPATSDQSSELIPLKAIADFTQVRISWYSQSALTSSPVAGSFVAGGNARDLNNIVPIPALQWEAAWPALLRVNVMQHDPAGIVIEPTGDLNPSFRTKSFFLYPTDTGAIGPFDPFTSPARRIASCQGPYAVGQGAARINYACQSTFSLSDIAGSERSYLQLQTLYKKTDFAVELLDSSGTPVAFDGVSPLIDSTGAAENVYRRILTRVKLSGANPIPPVVLDLGGGLCKNFSVTVNVGQFSENCDPQTGD